MSAKCLLVAMVLLGLSCVVISQKPLLCYYGSWAHYRSDRGQFKVEDIDPWLCTHVIYSFLGINEDGSIAILDSGLDIDMGNLKKFTELKNTNSNLKTLAAIGGYSVGSETFSRVAANPDLRWRFAENARDFCFQYGFDGIDMDWEYPGQRGGDPYNDKANFVLMLSNLREVLSANGLMLTAAVGAPQNIAEISYDIPGISEYVDFINLMTYDYNGAWDAYTGHNSPLYEGPSDSNDFQRTLNVHHSVTYWLQQGAPNNKLIVGVPIYGRTFTLQSSDNYWLRAGSSGPGLAGKYTNEAGSLAYFEICPFFTRRWVRHWEDNQKIPFAVTGDQWIGYDDVDSTKIKCDYINQHNLAGAMVWSIEQDDFHSYCGSKNPILNTLRDCL
ncbi:acidic mammalian chitinase-like [Malaya genurostris]|uniref:acidic mammalian chitinase-like n=1 Tax=Malaya genurostris TaxID=325434 RepID=UPI0026F382D6|nr:acidic mammalian chitinase-like [Malaya genurostris]